MKPTFLTAEWNNLILANYIVGPEILLPYLPVGTELDSYKGHTYVSLIGFMFEEVRLKGFKIPFHVSFEEVNLRFYVRYFDDGVWKRGAVFIKEIVPKRAISFVANTLYNEKYITRRMKHFFTKKDTAIHIGYSWKNKGKWNKIEATTAIGSVPMLAGSGEEFITEHYWGYSRYSPSTTYEYAVEHPAWKMYPVKEYVIDCDFNALYGSSFAALEHTAPDSVYVAAGSPISILGKKKITIQ